MVAKPQIRSKGKAQADRKSAALGLGWGFETTSSHHAEDLNKGSKTADKFLEFLTDWLIGHTIYEDKKLFKAI